MIFSSIISFYIPLFLCIVMYYGIYQVTQMRYGSPRLLSAWTRLYTFRAKKLKREKAASIRLKSYLSHSALPRAGPAPAADADADADGEAAPAGDAEADGVRLRKDTEDDASSTSQRSPYATIVPFFCSGSGPRS